MDENMDTGFDEFFGAFEGEDGNQTGAEGNEEEVGTEQQEPDEESAEDVDGSEGEEASESDETAEGNDEQEAEEVGAEEDEWLKEAISKQAFNIKVDKEERTVSFKDAPALLQKGAAFDRVKGQLETSRQNEQTLQGQLDQWKPSMDFLEQAAKEAGVEVKDLIQTFRMNLLTSKGMTEAEAREKLRADDLQKQLDSVSQKQTQKQSEETETQERMNRDLAEFRQHFPGVPITQELVEKLKPDVLSGMSITSAYLKMENARLAAEAETARKQARTAEQRKKNLTRTPGGQKDSGGQRKKDEFDDFFSAFDK